MKLLLCPDRPNIKWCTVADGFFAVSPAVYKPGFQEAIFEELKDLGEPEAVGYLLFHGGEEIRETFSPVTQGVLSKAAKSEKFLPEDNTITTRLLKIFMKRYPDAAHYLFCDTAFFAGLPREASTYAVPYEFTAQGVRKYGSNGLCHDWVCSKIGSAPGGVKKIVSIFAGNMTNVAAVNKGVPVETSSGFTPLEGIPSLNGCGDIDPTIIFQLHSAGLKFGDINRILTRESGFCGLAGRKFGMEEILSPGGTPGLDGVRDIYYYNVIKHIGYSIALMGGADAVAVSCKDTRTAMAFAKNLCARLEYPALKLKKGIRTQSGVQDVTGEGSGLKVFIAEYNPWKIMDEKIESKINPV